jgi:hypothetical protein
MKGIKEEEGKLPMELDWSFIEEMAKRMNKNKGKYELYNWMKPMDVEKLKQALARHFIQVAQGNYADDGDDMGHLLAISLNCMMLHHQLKRYPEL